MIYQIKHYFLQHRFYLLRKNERQSAYRHFSTLEDDDLDSAYRHPSTSHFSTGAFSALEDDDLDSRRRFGEYLGFGKDRDPRLNPKPPKGWQG